MGFVSMLVIFTFGVPTVWSLAEELDSAAGKSFVWSLAALGVFTLLAYLVLHFLDLSRRTYRVYNDVVVYEEGFLTRENAFIPYENIADAATKRSPFDQILNLYDVLVSCQGSSAEIKFRRLRRGMELSNAIDHLVVQARQKPAAATASARCRAVPLGASRFCPWCSSTISAS